MAILWILLSTRWSLSSVQAALNVFISVLGTVGLRSFSRFWWRRGSATLLREKGSIPLRALYTFTGPGDAWDLVAILRTRVFEKENWHLLAQLIVVLTITATCMFSGPIAKISLRNGQTIQQRDLKVMQTMKGAGGFSNLLYANVLWNDTIQSLDRANFPTTQMLDYLPPSTEPWTYVANEWDPTWSVACNETHETILPNVVAAGNHSIYEPLQLYSAFRQTFSSAWLDKSRYKITDNFDSWATWTDPQKQLKHVLWFVIIQSDPEVEDRMYTNRDTLELSLTVFHAQNFSAKATDKGMTGEETWMPFGPIQKASYARVECTITRKFKVLDENSIPWVWLNDTDSIAMGYRAYWEYDLEKAAGRGAAVTTPSPRDIFRFYQAYVVAANTNHSVPTPRKVSVWVDTVQLSVVFLIFLLLLSLMTFGGAGRHFFFLGRNKTQIARMYVPDGKIEWMIHAAKSSEVRLEDEAIEEIKFEDRDHFRAGVFGRPGFENIDDTLPAPKLARVYSSRISISNATPSIRSSRSKVRSISPSVVPSRSSSMIVQPIDEEHRSDLQHIPSFTSADGLLDIVVSPAHSNANVLPIHPVSSMDTNMLDPHVPARVPSVDNASRVDKSGHSFEHKADAPKGNFPYSNIPV
ncbi:uncharacterized protein N0V89_008922 [Didymosphaeria variabile]|uniref:Uncharacterized protein n=1 Tax=Didymosphaeria variabile TaxID=1932322 RepID=A0A9W9C902_9PLEO|nr:uncharacterized protein N0V89_008922 [Didymosphaeria variabile]KAJ4350301.1 hypothetical protein N0V89_008922 [Didymosphaeria variabile]